MSALYQMICRTCVGGLPLTQYIQHYCTHGSGNFGLYAMSHLIADHMFTWYFVKSCPSMSYPIISCSIMSCPVMSMSSNVHVQLCPCPCPCQSCALPEERVDCTCSHVNIPRLNLSQLVLRNTTVRLRMVGMVSSTTMTTTMKRRRLTCACTSCL